MYAPGAVLSEAFADAVAQARHEHGHGGYSGTVAEKTSVNALSAKVRWLDDAYDEAARLLDLDDDAVVFDKWGPAAALPVAVPTSTQVVHVAGSHPVASDWVAVAAQALGRSGSRVESATVCSCVRDHAAGVLRDVQLAVTLRRPEAGRVTRREVRVVVDAAAGTAEFHGQLRQAVTDKLRLSPQDCLGPLKVSRTESKWAARHTTAKGRSTRYVIVGDARHNRFDTGFATMAEAKARLKELAAGPHPRVGDRAVYAVEAVTRATDGSPLAELTRTLVSTRVCVTATVYRGCTEPTVADGWLLFGITSC